MSDFTGTPKNLMTMFINVTNHSCMVIIITMKFSEGNKLKCRKIARRAIKSGHSIPEKWQQGKSFYRGSTTFYQILSMISLN